MPNFMTVRLVGTEWFHAEGRTDTTKVMFTGREYANASGSLVTTLQEDLYICGPL
jgi:hypothetical protein